VASTARNFPKKVSPAVYFFQSNFRLRTGSEGMWAWYVRVYVRVGYAG